MRATLAAIVDRHAPGFKDVFDAARRKHAAKPSGGSELSSAERAELADVPRAERVVFMSGLTASALPVAAPAAAGFFGPSAAHQSPVGSASPVALLQIEHMYYKHDSIANAVHQAQCFAEKFGASGDIHPACQSETAAAAQRVQVS